MTLDRVVIRRDAADTETVAAAQYRAELRCRGRLKAMTVPWRDTQAQARTDAQRCFPTFKVENQ